jgi:hypothetical protein
MASIMDTWPTCDICSDRYPLPLSSHVVTIGHMNAMRKNVEYSSEVEMTHREILEAIKQGRLEFTRKSMPFHLRGCRHCDLDKDQHINDRFCPEWRLRQLDGDR